jgi:predicted TPR repeat methyltransferase
VDIIDWLRRLQDNDLRLGLVVAGDSFIYLGDMKEIFQRVGAALHADGVFAFSIESMDASDFDETEVAGSPMPSDVADKVNATQGYVMRGSGRYAHSGAYVRACAAAAGMSVAHELTGLHLRYEWGKAEVGSVIVLVKAGARRASFLAPRGG